MRFFAPITVLNLGATALPFLNKRDEPVNVLAPVQEEFTPPTYTEGTELFVIEATGAVEKRVNYMHVDVWRDTNKKGRHEGFYSELNKCYNIGNGWVDEISSVSVPRGYGCEFFKDTGCKNSDKRLVVPGGGHVANLKSKDFNDIISSYRCYSEKK